MPNPVIELQLEAERLASSPEGMEALVRAVLDSVEKLTPDLRRRAQYMYAELLKMYILAKRRMVYAQRREDADFGNYPRAYVIDAIRESKVSVIKMMEDLEAQLGHDEIVRIRKAVGSPMFSSPVRFPTASPVVINGYRDHNSLSAMPRKEQERFDARFMAETTVRP